MRLEPRLVVLDSSVQHRIRRLGRSSTLYLGRHSEDATQGLTVAPIAIRNDRPSTAVRRATQGIARGCPSISCPARGTAAATPAGFHSHPRAGLKTHDTDDPAQKDPRLSARR